MAEKKSSRREARRAGVPKAGPSRGGFSLTAGWATVLFAALVIVFFHEVSVGGKTFTSPDTIAPVGFVRMGEQALWQDRVYPLWNPFVFLGMPSFASGAYNPLIYPPDWPLALLGRVVPLPDMIWMLLYYVIGALGMFLLAREWGARPEGALLAGALFVFAPNLVAVGSHGHGSQLVNSAYLPLMLWFTARWLRRGRLSDLGWLALAGGFQMLRGHVQICFYTWAAIALYAGVEWIAALRDRVRRAAGSLRVAGLGVAALLAFGLAGFYTLPLRDYAQYSIRGGSDAGGGTGTEYATQWSMALYELPSAVIPSWVGFGGGTYWGGMPFTDYPNPFIGIVAALLAVPAFFGRGRARAFALLMGVVALLISLGRHFPLYGFLYEHLPLFNKFRIPVMVLLLYQLAAGLAVAWGWSDLLARRDAPERDRVRFDRLLIGLAAAVAVVGFGGALFQSAWESGYVQSAIAHNPRLTPDIAAAGARELAGDLGRAGILGVIAAGAAWLMVRGSLSVPLATAFALGVMLIELWPVSGRVMKPVIGEVPQNVLDVGRNDTVHWLEQAGPPGTFRILPIDEFQSNRFAGFGIASFGGYHAAKPRLVQDLLDSQAQGFFRWQRLLNFKYILIQRMYQELPDYLRPAYEGQTNLVLENMLALPRATVVGAYEVVQPARAIFDSVTYGRRDVADVTYLETDPGLTLGPVEGATAEIVSYRLNDVTVRVNTPGPGLLRLSDMWYPDWKATVDGAAAPVLRADYLLRAVAVPAGEHTVVFRFESAAVRNGLMLSIASLVLILALIGAGVMQGRGARGANGDAAGEAPAG
jgi:hypothetical protein